MSDRRRGRACFQCQLGHAGAASVIALRRSRCGSYSPAPPSYQQRAGTGSQQPSNGHPPSHGRRGAGRGTSAPQLRQLRSAWLAMLRSLRTRRLAPYLRRDTAGRNLTRTSRRPGSAEDPLELLGGHRLLRRTWWREQADRPKGNDCDGDRRDEPGPGRSGAPHIPDQAQWHHDEGPDGRDRIGIGAVQCRHDGEETHQTRPASDHPCRAAPASHAVRHATSPGYRRKGVPTPPASQVARSACAIPPRRLRCTRRGAAR